MTEASAANDERLTENKKIVLDFFKHVIAAHDPDAVSRFVSDGYRQHGPDVDDGLEAMEDFAERIFADEAKIDAEATQVYEPEFIIAEGDLVTICFYMPQADPADPDRLFDYFSFNTYRVRDGKLTDRWPNVHKYFTMRHDLGDGRAVRRSLAPTPGVVQDLDKNKRLVVGFYAEVLGPMNPHAVEKYVAEDYHQYCSHMPQGRAGLERFVEQISAHRPAGVSAGPPPSHDLIIAEGDIVVVAGCLSQPEPDGTGASWPYYAYDAYRIGDGRLSEHWSGINKAAPPQH